MIHEEKKAAKIIEELTMYFLSVGATKLHTGIQKEETKIILTFDSNYAPEYEEDVKTLDKYLHEPKNDGLADIYWELAGSGDPGESSQLLLVGMMVDSAEIEWKPNGVCLKLVKEMGES